MKNVQLLFLILEILFSGCSTRETLYRSVYEGLKMREQVVSPHPSDGPVPQKMPGYDEYKSERDKVLNSQ